MRENEDKVAIYSRKSRFTGKGESVGNQVDMCRAYIRTAFGDRYADTAVIFEDEGFSGGNLNRPGFRQMMRAARDRAFRAVVVYRLDRISRNISDFSSLIEELGRLGVDFVSLRENFDTSSPMGRAMMYIASVFSQLERETIAERIRDNMHELAKTGRWLGGVTPTGYESECVKTITVDGKNKKSSRLKLLPDEAAVVRTIFALYTQTGSLAMTEAELLRRGVKTKTGRSFTRFSLKGILQNPVYLIADEEARRYFEDRGAKLCSPRGEFDGVRGVLAYNRTDQQKGRATVYLPVREWIVAVGQHPGLIPARDWIGVQEALERGGSGARREPRGNPALLTGILRCACGGRMHAKLTGRTTADGRPQYVYVCAMKERSKRSLCSRKNADGARLDGAVAEAVGRLAGDDGLFSSRLEKTLNIAGERKKSEREELARQCAEIRRRIGALVDSLADCAQSAAPPIRERIGELTAQEAALRERMEEMALSEERRRLGEAEFDTIVRELAALRAGPGAQVEQRRACVRAAVRTVVWDGTRADVYLFGSEPGADAPGVRRGEDSK